MRTSVPYRHHHGSAVLIVLILLSLMVAFLVSNTMAINHLKREISLVEETQLKRNAARTNAPATKVERNK